jgi:hypothetical protein
VEAGAAADMDSPAAADTRIQAEQPAAIPEEATPAVAEHTLAVAMDMAVVEEAITADAVTAGIMAGAASD